MKNEFRKKIPDLYLHKQKFQKNHSTAFDWQARKKHLFFGFEYIAKSNFWIENRIYSKGIAIYIHLV